MAWSVWFGKTYNEPPLTDDDIHLDHSCPDTLGIPLNYTLIQIGHFFRNAMVLATFEPEPHYRTKTQ